MTNFAAEIRITPNDHRRRDVLAQIEALQNQIALERRQVEEIQSQLELIRPLREHMAQLRAYSDRLRLANDFPTLPSPSVRNTLIHDLLTNPISGAGIEQRQRNCDQQIANYAGIIRDRESHLSRYNTQLAALPETVTTVRSYEEIVAALAPMNVTDIRVMEGNKVRFIFHHLTLTPSANHYHRWVTSDTKQIHIPMLPVVCQLDFNSMDVRFHVLPSHSALYPIGASGVPSPGVHIFPEGRGCLGDYGGPLAEAMTAGDVNLAATVIQCFLEHANAEDSYGRNWFRWVHPEMFNHYLVNAGSADIGTGYACMNQHTPSLYYRFGANGEKRLYVAPQNGGGPFIPDFNAPALVFPPHEPFVPPPLTDAEHDAISRFWAGRGQGYQHPTYDRMEVPPATGQQAPQPPSATGYGYDTPVPPGYPTRPATDTTTAVEEEEVW